jgi:hypothetical protein
MVNYHLKWIFISSCKNIHISLLRDGSSFLFDITFNTSPKPHLQKVLPCRRPCHTRDLGLETPCELALNLRQDIGIHDYAVIQVTPFAHGGKIIELGEEITLRFDSYTINL